VLNALLLKELRLAVRARRVWWAAFGMTVLSTIAAMVGGAEHTARAELHRALTEFGEKSFGEQRPDHPHSIAHNGYVVSRAPAPLGFLDGGVEAAYGRYVRLDAHQTRPLTGARTAELSRGPGAGRFDLGLLFAVFAPVIVVLLGFDQIAGEKARGTWAMLRSAGVGANALALSKLCGLMARTSIAVGTPGVLLVTFASVNADVFGARTIAWLGVHALGWFAWCAIVLVLSASTRTVRGAFLGGIALWAGLALFVPPFAGGVARAWAPTPPSGEAMVKAAEWADSAHAKTEKFRAEAIRDLRRRYPEWDGSGDPPEVIDAVMLKLADAESSKKMFDLFAALDRESDRQERLAVWLAVVSPTGLASLASSALAGSDLAHLREAFRHFEAYRVNLMTWFDEWWAKQGRGGFDRYQSELQFTEFAGAPRPAQLVLPLSFALERAQLALALLVVLGLAGVIGLCLSLTLQLGGQR
jgi:ABC-2 type transport system permease protein